MSAVQKSKLHPRNLHAGTYDFPLLVKSDPELLARIIRGPAGQQTINFSDPASVKALNRALLKTHYGLIWWDIPPGSLCPPIPGRADYIHYGADLLASHAGGAIPQGAAVRVLDVGVGASCIYPIIGHAAYGWSFVGSDIMADSLRSSQKIIASNPGLSAGIELRLQPDKTNIFRGLIRDCDRFDLTVCNPPFHSSALAALETNQTRLSKMGLTKNAAASQNFGGHSAELWCEGGEAGFIARMIEQSPEFSRQCGWFSTLVSRRESLAGIYRKLKTVKPREIRTIPMSQGQKISRIVAWTFREWRPD